MKLRNETSQCQQIHFINGDCITVSPKEKIDIDEFDIYAEELQRVCHIFRVVQFSKKTEPKKEKKWKEEKETSDLDSVNEVIGGE